MSHDVVVRAEGLGKKYVIGHQAKRENYAALRDVIARSVAGFARSSLKSSSIAKEEFWALRDISFEVKKGEVLGIIGRNGAGKSTLLKVLSRITEPTEGRVLLRGRVGSLLEVGTGFHPELTGRENIFLNGAILGMRRADIKRKFDQIVAFAGIERFLDLPVKKYSSGMYVRLAFSVAAYLDPEILIVDEVLAVGDHDFQQKCLGKMHDVASKEGRTVLLVSHNLAAISEMAHRAILLDSGRIVLDGPVSNTISSYLSKGLMSPIYICPRELQGGSPHVRRIQVFASNPNGVHSFGESLEIKFWIRHNKPMSQGCFSFQVINQYQHPIIHCFAYNPDLRFGGISGESVLTCRFPSLRLNVGQFYLRTFLAEPPGGEHYETVERACSFEVVRTDRSVLWGWRPELCAYHEECTWKTVDSQVLAESRDPGSMAALDPAR